MFLQAHRFSRATYMRFQLSLLPPLLPPSLLPASVHSACRGPRGLQMGQSVCAQAACGCSSAVAAAMKASVISSSYTVSATSSTCTVRCRQLRRYPVLATMLPLLQITNTCYHLPLKASARRFVQVWNLYSRCAQHAAKTTASIPPPAAVHGDPQRSSRLQPPTAAARTLCSDHRWLNGAPSAAAPLAAGLSSPGSGPSWRYRQQRSFQRSQQCCPAWGRCRVKPDSCKRQPRANQ